MSFVRPFSRFPAFADQSFKFLGDDVELEYCFRVPCLAGFHVLGPAVHAARDCLVGFEENRNRVHHIFALVGVVVLPVFIEILKSLLSPIELFDVELDGGTPLGNVLRVDVSPFVSFQPKCILLSCFFFIFIDFASSSLGTCCSIG